ncbi:tRNA N6-adenosine threonylcarbamoyltransferase, putative [Plasmodium malariae]|uniref:N(6)-L-threonylcarbamoyladenine synthase n=1 Tax=Plasmodium malariae TaxID=5858 RepID=A0A1C3KE20_PLAMA|nr:tRNA N6-adenosine threonylcarbamoyltransferase, putative [Plasmodium malariae]
MAIEKEKGVQQKRCKQYVLGIEGSANKLGVSIINEEKKILVNMRRTYISEIGCGFIPREINAHHKYYIIDMIKNCLNKLSINIRDISLICYTRGPGIGSALYIAYNICKIFSLLFNIPVIGVNHCIAHIEMGIYITKLYHPIILYVSGGNTQIIYYNNYKKRYEIIGETLDIAIGNVIDRSARILKISNSPSPGYNVELLARQKYLLNIMKKQTINNNAKEINGYHTKHNDHSHDEFASHSGKENTGDSKWDDDISILTDVQHVQNNQSNVPNELRKKKKKKKKNYDDTCDFTELLFFPYTIKGMDISFSGYDFYISKYFAKYITNKKAHKKERGGVKNRAGETDKLNQNIKKKAKSENNALGGEDTQTSDENQSEDMKNITELHECKESDKRGNIEKGRGANDLSEDAHKCLHYNSSLHSGMKGNSYYEDNIIYKSKNKKNYGGNDDGDTYVTDDCSIETDSDFYEKDLKEAEKEVINLTDEEKRKIQICYSLQHHIFSMLIEITERAISFTNSKEVIIVGGVGCNLFLQNMMKKMAKQKNIKIGFMDHSYCVDNGAMIAYTGYLEYLHAKDKSVYNFENISIHQRYRTDDVLVTWR